MYFLAHNLGMEKRCPKCQMSKPVSEFGRNKARDDGLTGYCWSCHRAVETASRIRLRRALIEEMGGKCVACGYDKDWRALQIDHIHGDGATERRASGNVRTALFKKIRANLERYALLCANCNQIKRIENAEHVGKRIYNRVAPTERIRKPRDRTEAMRKAWVTRRNKQEALF
jgi:hypothetical protein